MASILERLDDLIRGNLHRFVDRALENNSLALFDQDVRDMARAIDHVEEAATTMYAAARANERRLAEHQENLERLGRRVEQLTAQGVAPTSERMMVARAELEAKRDLVAQTQAQIARQQAQYETLKKRVPELELRAQVLRDARPRLETLLTVARAYRSVERVEMTLEGLRGLGGDTEVAAVADSIYQRLGEAQARLDALYASDEAEAEAEIEAELAQVGIEDQLAERRQRLGLELPEPSASPSVSPPASPETPVPEKPPSSPAPEEESEDRPSPFE